MDKKPKEISAKHPHNTYKQDIVVTIQLNGQPPKYSTHIPQCKQRHLLTMTHNQMQTNKQPNGINTHRAGIEKNPYSKPSVIFLPPCTRGTYTISHSQNLKLNIVHVLQSLD